MPRPSFTLNGDDAPSTRSSSRERPPHPHHPPPLSSQNSHSRRLSNESSNRGSPAQHYGSLQDLDEEAAVGAETDSLLSSREGRSRHQQKRRHSLQAGQNYGAMAGSEHNGSGLHLTLHEESGGAILQRQESVLRVRRAFSPLSSIPLTCAESPQLAGLIDDRAGEYERFRKSPEQLKAMRKPLRKFYTRQNETLDAFQEVDEVLENARMKAATGELTPGGLVRLACIFLSCSRLTVLVSPLPATAEDSRARRRPSLVHPLFVPFTSSFCPPPTHSSSFCSRHQPQLRHQHPPPWRQDRCRPPLPLHVPRCLDRRLRDGLPLDLDHLRHVAVYRETGLEERIFVSGREEQDGTAGSFGLFRFQYVAFTPFLLPAFSLRLCSSPLPAVPPSLQHRTVHRVLTRLPPAVIASFLQVLIESLQKLFSPDLGHTEIPPTALIVMGATIVIKAGVWVSCRAIKSASVEALQQDAENDVRSCSCSSARAVLMRRGPIDRLQLLLHSLPLRRSTAQVQIPRPARRSPPISLQSVSLPSRPLPS
jgi:hypothetical protein